VPSSLFQTDVLTALAGPTADRLSQLRADALAALRHGDPARAAELARELVAANPRDAVAAQALGHALLMQDRPREAVDGLRASAALSQDPALETLFARALARAGQREAALGELQRTTRRRPAFVLAFLELGELLAQAGCFDEAQAVFADGLALTPDSGVLRVGLGQLCLKLNDRARARAEFEAVRRAAPQRFDAAVGLATVLELDGDFRGAADLYRSALALRPDAPTQIRLGRCLLELGERVAGEAALRAAAGTSPQATGLAIAALAAAARGRLFLKPGAAAGFLRGEAA
jgi:tetratricopeptide (TPR) repeat protein